MFVDFALYDAAGAPLTGATPTFTAYKDRAGANRTAPTVSELGLGLYAFTSSAADDLAGVAYLINGGAGGYVSGALGAADLNAFALFDAASAPTAAATPAFAAYKATNGANVTPPTITNLGLGLYGFVPAAQELRDGAAFEISTGAYPARLFGGVEYFNAPLTDALPDVASDIATYLASVGSLGLTLGSNLFASDELPEFAIAPTVPEVYVMASGGDAPKPYLGTGSSIHRMAASVIVRGVPMQKRESYLFARQVAACLQIAPISGYVSVFLRDSQPVYLGIAEHDAPGWSIGVVCTFQS